MADDAVRIAQLEAELHRVHELHIAEIASLRQREATLVGEAEHRGRALTEASEQQTATREILRVIASSPTEVQPVLDAIVASATRVTDAASATLWRVHEGVLRGAASSLDASY